MNKIISNFLFLALSSTAVADDVFQRINECEQRTDRDCIIAILRELAQEKNRYKEDAGSSYDKGGNSCTVEFETRRDGNFYLKISNGKLEASFPYYTITMDRAQAITYEWKHLQCDNSSKIGCQMVDRNWIMFAPDKKMAQAHNSTSKDILAELNKSICM
jgi:hypothetical protein